MPAPGRVAAALAGGAQIVAAFLAWTAGGVAGIDVPAAGVRVGLLLVVFAAVPMTSMLVSDRGWPRTVSGCLTATLVVGHLAGGPDGVATTGVLVAAWAAIGQWLAAALATTAPVEVPRIG